MEVLISVFVLSIGMLGLASLLPVGSYTILEATKADRGGDCGRAALRDIKVRRMLAGVMTSFTPTTTSLSVMVDPLGMSQAPALPGTVAGTALPRISLPLLAQSFFWPDDLVVSMPEEQSPPLPFGRSQLGVNGPQGDYSWFFTATGTNDPTRWNVTAVVCYKRDFTEQAFPVQTFYDMDGTNTALGGGSILLHTALNSATGPPVRANQYVALYNSGTGLCCWYRVVSVSQDPANPAAPTMLTLTGPDWPNANQPCSLIALGLSAIGAYTMTMELDQDPSWQQ